LTGYEWYMILSILKKSDNGVLQ